MNTFSRFGAASALTVLVLGSAPGLIAADITLQKAPPLTVEQAPAYPENLARYHLGANVEAAPSSHPIANLQLSTNSEDKNAAEAALLCDDPTVGYALPAGKTTILVSLPKIENVGSISFMNKGAQGDLAIATSSAKLPADSPQWNTAVERPLSPDTVEAKVGPNEAKYVRLTFNLAQPGRIAGFGVYSSPQVSDFTTPRTRKLPLQDKSDSFALISYNLTDIHAKARALYVSSGNDVKQANNMIDDQTGTSFSFAAEDGSPTTVIALGKPSTLRRLSVVYSPRAGNMEFYVLQSLPGVTKGAVQPNAAGSDLDPAPTPENAPTTVTLDDAAFASMKSVGAVSDDGSRGRASVDFPTIEGRYVLLRWIPSSQQNDSFAVAEVAAFGGAGQRNTLLAANSATANDEAGIQDSDGKTMLDGKTMIDTKEMPAEGPAQEAPQSPAEGPAPTLPQPPPFTFVPVLVPISQ